ncbi:MAG: fasciclin domain-containing protein [Ginsengibacter sp.]
MQHKISTRILTITMVSLSVLFMFVSCKKKNDPVQVPGTITAIVSNSPDFTFLKAAVVKAGLAATLDGKSPFTVFAPTNDAFMASGITMATINQLSPDALKGVLLYHTVSGKAMAKDLPSGPNANIGTVSGKDVFVTKNDKGVFVNGVTVTKADIMATNGVIHAISRVLMPPAGNIVETASANPDFTFLVAAVVRASQGNTNVASVLSGAGPFTLFAPTNDAFKAAGFATMDAINNADPNTLTTILTYHVIEGRVFSSDLTNAAMPKTVNGGTVTINLTNGATVKGNSNTTASKITSTDLVTTNGVIHTIDQVLLP